MHFIKRNAKRVQGVMEQNRNRTILNRIFYWRNLEDGYQFDRLHVEIVTKIPSKKDQILFCQDKAGLHV